MIKNNLNNPLDSKVFEGELDFKTLENILDSINHVVPKKILREEFENLDWEFLMESRKDKFWKSYVLFLPEDLVYWELLFLINFLVDKFNLYDYTPFEQIFSQVKVMIWIILRWWWKGELKDLQKKYNLSNKFVEKILSQNLINNYSKEFIKSIEEKRETKKKIDTRKSYIWKEKEDFEIWITELKKIFWQEFDLTFFRKWVNMFRLWMMTITQNEQELLIKENKWNKKFKIYIDSKYLDEQERLLRKKIWIQQLKERLEKARKNWEKDQINKIKFKASNKIMTIMKDYPYLDWKYKLNENIKDKIFNCVWYSILWHSFLNELWIKHNWLSFPPILWIPWHTVIEVIIWDKRFLLDSTAKFDKLLKFKYIWEFWAYKKINLLNKKWENALVQSWNPEKMFLAQFYNSKWSFLNSWEKWEEAILMFDKAIWLNSKDSSIYYNKWNSLYMLKKYNEAIKMYKKAIDLNPSYFNAYHNKWHAFFKLWKYEEALKMYAKAVELNPDFMLLD